MDSYIEAVDSKMGSAISIMEADVGVIPSMSQRRIDGYGYEYGYGYGYEAIGKVGEYQIFQWLHIHTQYTPNCTP